MLPASTRGLTTRYVVVMLIVALLSVLAFLALYFTTIRGERMLGFVKTCDEERSRAVHIAYFATRLSQPGTTAEHDLDRQRLDQETTELLKQEKTLVAPGGSLDQVSAIAPDVKYLFLGGQVHLQNGPPTNLDKVINDYAGLARIISAVPEGDLTIDDQDIAHLQEESVHDIVEGLSLAVNGLRDTWQKQRMIILFTEVGIFGATLLALVFTGFFVFRPMVKLIVAENQELILSERRLTAVINTVGEADAARRVQGHGRGRQPRQERVPRQHEPRDPHAHERRHRHDRVCCSRPSSTPRAARVRRDAVRTSGESLLAIINDILDFSKIEAGRLKLNEFPFDLRSCVQEALDLIAPKAREKHIDLVHIVHDDLPTSLIGDDQRLRQVLLNLVGNAIKFTDRGEVSLEITGYAVPVEESVPPTEGGTEQRDLWEIAFAIKDTGMGIPHDKMELLFKAFSQVEASATRSHGGTGLGLVICERPSCSPSARLPPALAPRNSPTPRCRARSSSWWTTTRPIFPSSRSTPSAGAWRSPPPLPAMRPSRACRKATNSMPPSSIS
jgi:signal transduction histidine kinase